VTGRRPDRRRRRRRSAGFTLVELMVAVVLSGVIIGFVFQIHAQMTGALRGQANLSEVVESVTAARELLAREIRLAGMGFPASGVRWGTGANEVWYGVEAVNDADGAGADVVDSISIQRTEGDVYDVIADEAGDWTVALVDADDLGFSTAAPVVIINRNNPPDACATTPIAVDATGLRFAAADFVNPASGPCGTLGLSDDDSIQITRLRKASYRLDPVASNLEQGVLQRSINDGPWDNLGVGYTNLQFAVRYFEAADAADADADGDALNDWYSGDEMEVAYGGRLATGAPVQVGLSIEARNQRRIDNLASSATPAYTDLARPNNNPLGNFGQACTGAQYDPCGVPDLNDPGVPSRYAFPDRVYRSTSTTVWLRSRLDSL
jgi:prepilin-type N-terminal cleavage/methylation domain-containing protein